MPGRPDIVSAGLAARSREPVLMMEVPGFVQHPMSGDVIVMVAVPHILARDVIPMRAVVEDDVVVRMVVEVIDIPLRTAARADRQSVLAIAEAPPESAAAADIRITRTQRSLDAQVFDLYARHLRSPILETRFAFRPCLGPRCPEPKARAVPVCPPV